MTQLDTRPLWAWANERQAIYHRKRWLEDGVTLPAGVSALGGQHLTVDPILSEYRFCNVFREQDRVTKWVKEHIRDAFADHPNLWMMLAIARYINWPPTLAWVMTQPGAWPLDEDFSPHALHLAMEARAVMGEKVYTGAYMIRAESDKKADWYDWPKSRYIAEIVLGRLWKDRGKWEHFLGPQGPELLTPSIRSVHKAFLNPHYIGWGPFMSYQVCVDMIWTRYLHDAPDIDTWAALGPGSRRGLNRLAGRDLDYPLTQEDGLIEMRIIHAEQDRFRAPWVPHIIMSDIQNCLCETDKYLRVKTGEGKPRAKFIRGRGH